VCIEELRKCVKLTKERGKAKSAPKIELIEILVGYKKEEIYNTLTLDELTKVAINIIAQTLENQRREKEEKNAAVKSLSVDEEENKQNQEISSENQEKSVETDEDEMADNDQVKFKYLMKKIIVFGKREFCYS